MAGTSSTISTNNTSFNVGDTLSVTITFGSSREGTLYIGNNSISIPHQKTPSYTYDYVLTTSGNYSVYFHDSNVLDSNIINITVTDSSSSSSVFLTTITKVKTALENVFVKKSDVKDNLTSTDTDKPLSANQGKSLKTLVDGKSNTNHSHGYITNDGYLDGIFETTNELSIIEPYISDSSGIECLYALNGKLVYDGDNEILVYDKEGFTEIAELDESSEIATLDDIPNVTGKEDKSNKVSSWSDPTTDTNYPSEKLVKNSIDNLTNSIDNFGNYFSTGMNGVYSTLNNYQNKNMGVGNKNVVTNESGYITTEDKPTIPSASSTTPSADTTSGSVGTGTTWAKADHTHPKSSLYAEASHNHDNYLTSHQDISGKEDKSNKSSSISTDTGSTTKYPTVKAVEDYAQPIGNYLTSHQDLSNYVQKSQTNGLIKNDGTIDTNTYSQTNHTHSSLTGIEIPLGADLNDYTTEGYYYHSPGQYSNVLHTPVTMLTGFKLIVSTRTHPNGTIIKNQIFINEVTNTIYIRDSHTKTEYWSDWYHFYTPNTNPIVSSFSNQLSDNNIPSEKLVKNSLDTKQDTLVSGTNIKSINGSSLIGSGNLTINPRLNGYCDDGTSGYNIFEDTNGDQMFFMDYKLVFDFDTGKIYYDPLNLYNYSSNMEIATIGDIPNISGKANSSDFDTVTVTVIYTDNTTENLVLYKQVTQNQS